jgi:hypothetical protein
VLKAAGYVRGSYVNVPDKQSLVRRIEWWLGHGRCVVVHDYTEDNLAAAKVQTYTTWPNRAGQDWNIETFRVAVLTDDAAPERK